VVFDRFLPEAGQALAEMKDWVRATLCDASATQVAAGAPLEPEPEPEPEPELLLGLEPESEPEP
jgi:hypothetical protein